MNKLYLNDTYFAIQFTGTKENFEEIKKLLGNALLQYGVGYAHTKPPMLMTEEDINKPVEIEYGFLLIKSYGNNIFVYPGDYIMIKTKEYKSNYKVISKKELEEDCDDVINWFNLIGLIKENK